MVNYIIWKTEDGELMVEVLNFCDIAGVQKELIEKGYIIISICRGVFETSTFMKIEKVDEK